MASPISVSEWDALPLSTPNNAMFLGPTDVPAKSSSPVGLTIPSEPTPIAGGSFTAIGASMGGFPGAGLGLLLDGGKMWWQKHLADKAAAKQLREARRLNSIEQENRRKQQLEARRQFEMSYGLSREGFEFNKDQTLRAERTAKVQRIQQGILNRLSLKNQARQGQVQRSFI